MEAPPGTETILNGTPFLYFAGTGYLGLQAHPELIAAAEQAARQYGIHTATTRSGFGTAPPIREVERRAADLLAAGDACYLVSGYAGNFALAAAIGARVDVVLLDTSAHDCLREATRWLDNLKLPPLTFRHCDASHVAELLARHVAPGQRALLMTDGVVPASGRIAPLSDYLAILDRHEGAMLLVDDAHGLGVLGEHGRGSLEWAGVPPDRINRDDESAGGSRVFHTATLSKAIGGHGGLIAGATGFQERVRTASGWFRGASAPAAPVAAATAKGLEIVQADPTLRQRLAANVELLRDKLRSLGLDVERSPSPIIGLSLDSAERMQTVHRRLLEAGIAIGYTRDYAGAPRDGMLRIAVFATHTPDRIDRLVDALRQNL